jgi:hypothetical protein
MTKVDPPLHPYVQCFFQLLRSPCPKERLNRMLKEVREGEGQTSGIFSAKILPIAGFCLQFTFGMKGFILESDI